MKKVVIGTSILAAALLSSCGHNEQTKELYIDKKCNPNGSICSFELTDAEVNHQTNVLGKTRDTIVKTYPLTNIKGDITWNAGNAPLANNTVLKENELRSCENDKCGFSSNPTGFIFDDKGVHTVSVSGKVTVNDKEYDLSSVKAVDVDTKVDTISKTFTIADNNPTRPPELTTQAIVDALNVRGVNAHATFRATSATQWSMTCDNGYTTEEDELPRWGEDVTTKSWMVIAEAVFDGNTGALNATSARDANYMRNGWQDSEGPGQSTMWFSAGCFKK